MKKLKGLKQGRTADPMNEATAFLIRYAGEDVDQFRSRARTVAEIMEAKARHDAPAAPVVAKVLFDSCESQASVVVSVWEGDLQFPAAREGDNL